MKKYVKRLIAMLCVIGIVVSNPGMTVYAAVSNTKANIKITDGHLTSSTIKFGKDATIKGRVSSRSDLKYVVFKITNSDESKIYYKYKAEPDRKAYTIKSKANDKMKFDKLPLGSYKFIITAKNKDGKYKTLVKDEFKVTGPKSTLDISAKLSKKTIYKGKPSTLSGTIKSNYKINSVTVQILDTKYKKTVKPNEKSYKISSAVDEAMRFDKLKKGTHTLKITAKDASGKTVTEKLTIKVKEYEYKSISYDIKGIKQRTYSDCAFASMTTCELYNESVGEGHHGKMLLKASDPYSRMKRANGNSTYGYWYNIGYEKKYSTSADSLYRALKKGPVIVHKQNGYRTHYSVVYGYEGSNDKVSKGKFLVYEVTNGQKMSLTTWLGPKTRSNINGSGTFDHMVVKN